MSEVKIDHLPAISIVAPMYNVEKYIGQCLESVLHQTFEDFEFIITDDCSTDKSAEIVESYIPKFSGRLKLIKLDQNSGSAVLPRNIGLAAARGKYISFMDTDDLFTKTALEELYNIAEETQADIVNAEKHYEAKPTGDIIDESTPTIVKSTMLGGNFVDRPTVDSNPMSKRVMEWAKKRFSEYPWDKLYRHDFLTKNNLRFPEGMRVRDDTLFSFYCVCLADKIVRIPNVVNIYRVRTDSLSNDKVTIKLDDYLNKWLTDIIEFVRNIEQFMSKFDLFKRSPEYKYMPINRFLQEEMIFYMTSVYKQFQPHQIDAILRKEFSAKPDEDAALLTYFFSLANVYRLHIISLQQQNTQLKQQVEALKKALGEANSK